MFKKAGKTSSQRLGQRGEKLALKHLKRTGYQVIEVNYRTKLGELDLIATKGEYLVFVEVKTRTNLNPLLQMTKRKTDQVRKLALAYILAKDLQGLQPRFDVIAVTKEESKLTLEHLENAF